MSYTKKPKEAAAIIFKDCIIAENEIIDMPVEDIDWDIDVEIFLDKYCIAHGKEENIIDNIVLLIKEELNSRMDYFTCETDEAKRFLKEAIEEKLLNTSSTLFCADSLYSSFYDTFEYKVYQYNGQYFIMNWEEAEFDPEYKIDGWECYTYELIQKAIEKYKS